MAALLALGGCGDGHDHAGHDHGQKAEAPAADPNAKPYPLKTCVVSSEELGKMGEPHRIVHAGHEVLFCCAGCEKDFKKDPHKYMQVISGRK